MDCRVKLTLFWSGSLVYTGVTIWHGKQALTFVSTILSMHGNHTFFGKIALDFTMPWCPSWAMTMIRSCSVQYTTRRFKQDSVSTGQLLATQEFVYRNENRKRISALQATSNSINLMKVCLTYWLYWIV